MSTAEPMQTPLRRKRTQADMEAQAKRRRDNPLADYFPAVAEERARTLKARNIKPNQGDLPYWMRDRTHYMPTDMLAPAVRPGADNHQALPSRVGNKLFYRNGQVVTL